MKLSAWEWNANVNIQFLSKMRWISELNHLDVWLEHVLIYTEKAITGMGSFHYGYDVTLARFMWAIIDKAHRAYQCTLTVHCIPLSRLRVYICVATGTWNIDVPFDNMQINSEPWYISYGSGQNINRMSFILMWHEARKQKDRHTDN